MKQLAVSPALYDYIQDISLREAPILNDLRAATALLPLAGMQVAPEQAQFMQWLIQLIDARFVLELGTFTGYSTLALAMALPEDGQLITCDINEEWTKIALPFWKRANQEKKIQLRLAPALISMQNLIKEGYSQRFDFIFIDADKTNYCHYYELALHLISRRGIIAIDNIFWGGKVIDKQETKAQTREIRRLNDLIKHDQRVDISLLTIADGLFLIKKR